MRLQEQQGFVFFHSLATRKLLINPKQKKKNVLKTYNYYKYKKEKRSLPLNCREVALVFYDSISRKLNALVSSVDLRDQQSQGGSCFAIHLEIFCDGEGSW